MQNELNPTLHATRRFRFTLGLLFFLTLCVAGLLGGYRLGFQEGYAKGARKRESEKPVAKVYPVGDLLTSDIKVASPAPSDYDSLIGVIQETIGPDTWTDAGGLGAIEVLPTRQILIINQTSDIHDKIENLLRAMREASIP